MNNKVQISELHCPKCGGETSYHITNGSEWGLKKAYVTFWYCVECNWEDEIEQLFRKLDSKELEIEKLKKEIGFLKST